MVQEDDECIYRGSFMEDLGSSILVTGCEDEERSLQIHSLMFGDTLATGSSNGTILPVLGGFIEDEEDVVEKDDFFLQFGDGSETEDFTADEEDVVENNDFFFQSGDEYEIK